MKNKKTAVVTGATRGIGRCIAENLERDGYQVVYADRSFKPMDSGLSARGLDQEENPVSPIYVPCDIANPSDRQRLLSETLNNFGQVDLLVNNAGIAPEVRLDILETTEESFEKLMRVNLEGTFFMCQLFANQMIKQVSDQYHGMPENSASSHSAPVKPRIINIASISSYTSSVSRGEYCISKAGISMVTQLFADRLAAYGIGVFEIRPGIILTDMTEGVKEKYTRMIEDGLTPIKRLGMPQDVADVVIAVSRGGFDFCTGQVFNADGGFHIRRL